ncbi:hypothetical protein GG851_26890 [Bordetella petrii]|nr:hypothetical protein [Bordetella petrii]
MRRLWAEQAGLARFLSAAVLLLCTAAPAHAAFGDCFDPSYRARFDPRLETIPHDCVERLRVDVSTDSGARRIRLVHDRDAGWALLPGVVNEFERGIRAAAEALQQIGSFDMDDVTVLLIDGLPPREGSSESFSDIAATAGASNHECHIGAYLLSPGGTVSYAAYVVAHEIFHCVQRASLTPAQNSTGGLGTGSGGDWWLEGSAEWFAALSLPVRRVAGHRRLPGRGLAPNRRRAD